MWWRKRNTDVRTLVEECEAFIAGHSSDVVASSGRPVPVWARMNQLAHGTEDELRNQARAGHDPDPWTQAMGFVAGELIELIDSGQVSLMEFQHEVLIPLELEVMSCRTADQWSPGQLAAGLLGALPHRTGGVIRAHDAVDPGVERK
jgi:hypothetical protein